MELYRWYKYEEGMRVERDRALIHTIHDDIFLGWFCAPYWVDKEHDDTLYEEWEIKRIMIIE